MEWSTLGRVECWTFEFYHCGARDATLRYFTSGILPHGSDVVSPSLSPSLSSNHQQRPIFYLAQVIIPFSFQWAHSKVESRSTSTNPSSQNEDHFKTRNCLLYWSKSHQEEDSMEDLPDHLLESIVERLPLLEHYNGWAALVSFYHKLKNPFPRQWILREVKIICSEACPFDHYCRTGPYPIDFSMTHIGPHQFNVNFLEPAMNKKQEVQIRVKGQSSEFGQHQAARSKNSAIVMTRNWCYWSGYKDKGWTMTHGKGLIVIAFGGGDVICENVQKTLCITETFYVLNPITHSVRILPKIPFMNGPEKVRQRAILKLVVEAGNKEGVTRTGSSSYKIFVVEQLFSKSFRIIFYDSIFDSWAFAGIESAQFSVRGLERHVRYNTGCFLPLNSSVPLHWKKDSKIFLMRDQSIILSLGLFEHFLKFKYSTLVGTLHSPLQLNEIERNCGFNRSLRHCWGDSRCRCISATVFQAEEKLFYFKQQSWVSPFGPNCISATIWELDEDVMWWIKHPTPPIHMLQTCNIESRYSGDFLFRTKMFRFEELLLVMHHDLYHVAAFDISKKVWGKVPESILQKAWHFYDFITGWSKPVEDERRIRGIFKNPHDVDSFVFEPCIHSIP